MDACTETLTHMLPPMHEPTFSFPESTWQFYTSHASVEHAYESSDVVVARNVADVGMGSRVLGIQPASPNGPNLV